MTGRVSSGRRKMASVFNFSSRNITNAILLSRYKRIHLRCLSTGIRSNQQAGIDSGNKTQFQEIPDFSKPLDNKNWVSYGYDEEDETRDIVKMHGSSFFAITVCIIFGGFFLMYMPDIHHKHWSKREAYIRLYEREKLGLDPISPDYVDPEKIVLPSDEELGDTEIII